MKHIIIVCVVCEAEPTDDNMFNHPITQSPSVMHASRARFALATKWRFVRSTKFMLCMNDFVRRIKSRALHEALLRVRTLKTCMTEGVEIIWIYDILAIK